MILAIDVGNTNIVIGSIDNGEIRNVVRIHTDTRETEAEYTIKLKEIFYAYGMAIEAFDGAILSSVVPQVTGALCRAVKLLTGLDCMVVGPGMKTGMNVRVDDPGTVAGDLITGGVAAMQYYGTPVIVLDLGTATTCTVVDRGGNFRGGAILPGIKLSYNALAAGTSLLFRCGVRYGFHDRRHDRAHGRGAGREMQGGGHRRSGRQHHPLVPPCDHLRRRSAAQRPLVSLSEEQIKNRLRRNVSGDCMSEGKTQSSFQARICSRSQSAHSSIPSPVLAEMGMIFMLGFRRRTYFSQASISKSK